MRIDSANSFQSFILDEHEDQVARAVSPYFYAFLHNKIAAYAHAVLESKEPEDHKLLKAQVEVLQELMGELIVPKGQPQTAQS